MVESVNVSVENITVDVLEGCISKDIVLGEFIAEDVVLVKNKDDTLIAVSLFLVCVLYSECVLVEYNSVYVFEDFENVVGCLTVDFIVENNAEDSLPVVFHIVSVSLLEDWNNVVIAGDFLLILHSVMALHYPHHAMNNVSVIP